MRRLNNIGTIIFLFVAISVVPLTFVRSAVGAAGDTPSAAAQPGQSAASPADSEYVGAERCKTCHEKNYDSWSKSVHFRTTLDTRGGPSKQGCEACHGAGASHAADPSDKSKIFLFKKASPGEVNARCLTCHASGPTHLNSPNSFHRQNDVSCIDCHSPHHATVKESLLVKSQPALCYSCHLQQKSQFNMPEHHRVNEGLIQCTDCHNQHGTGGVWESDHLVRQLRTSDSGDFVCYKCHADKQGPFVFAHASVKVEGCATCHIPHGGANPHMLKYSNVNLLCLQCHTTAALPHGPSMDKVMDAQNATQQQACTLCHVQIHGSNFSNYFFR
ncbi:MAG: DmsE family decaheme c-type cytochrome [Acidobacteriia bacterium]|nr:DmsE family decaheme c-type cytochrome [Terriglobia bacterium]